MKIEITQLPETKTFTSGFKRYKATYPEGYPVHVRRVWHCEDCGIEVGGYFGNKVYRYQHTKKCQTCGEKNDPIAQMCVRLTGLTPAAYQQKHGRAWNE